jgi:hypothetical protein
MTRTGWLIACGALVTGCVKADGLSDAELRNAGDSLGAGIEDSAKAYGPLNTADADAACVVLSGDTTDTDQDSIPVNARLTYNCTSHLLGYTGMLTGTLSATDDQPSAVAWAFTGMADLHATLTGPFGGSIERDWSGQLKGTQNSAVGPFTTTRKLDVTTVFTPAGPRPRETTVTEDNDWTVTFTPMVSWTPGGVAVTGSLSASGTWNVQINGEELAATLSTPTPLRLEPACATRVTSGVARGTYMDGKESKSITVTWTGCGVHTVDHGL